MKDISALSRSLFFYILISSCFFLSFIELSNYDIWWHLKSGQWIIQNLRVPRLQLFSYSIGDLPWVSHSWFFQVLIFLVYRFLGGINSLILLRAVIVSLILWVSLRGFLKKTYPPLFLATGFLCSILFLARIPLRPELVSAFFLALYLYILFNKKNLWLLVPIQCLWVNMHGYSVLGPILLSLFILSEFIKEKIKLPFDWNSPGYFNGAQVYSKGLLILAITFTLLLFSPYGINNLKYPFFAIKGFFDTADNFYRISELAPSYLTDILFTQKNILLKAVSFLFMVSLLFNIRKANLFTILLYPFFLLMYCAANRHNGFFAVCASFCILDNFKAVRPRANTLSIILTLLIGFYITGYQFSKIKELGHRYVYTEDLDSKSYALGSSVNRYPEKAVDFILKNRIKGPIFNGFNIGGYLIWRLYPSYKVFIDGRTEVYGKSSMDEFAYSLIDFERWKELDDRYGFNIAILDYSTRDFYYYLIKNLYESEEWKLVYLGDTAVVFVKDLLINKALIASYNISFDNLKDKEIEKGRLLKYRKKFPYPAYFLNKARFFIQGMDMPHRALENLKKAELINPECYEVYQLTGYTHFSMRDFEQAEKAFTRSLEINPDIAEPYLNLGSVAAEKGLYKKAYSLYKHALHLDKDNKVARDNLRKLPGVPTH